MTNGGPHRASILAAIVALIFIGAAVVTGVAITGHASDSTPLVSQVLGFIALALIALLGLIKAEKVEQKTEKISEEVNGRLSDVEEKVNNK